MEALAQQSRAADGCDTSVQSVPVCAVVVVGNVDPRVSDIAHAVGRGDRGQAVAGPGIEPVVGTCRWRRESSKSESLEACSFAAPAERASFCADQF